MLQLWGEHHKSASNKASNIKCFICGGPHKKAECSRREEEENKKKLNKNNFSYIFNINRCDMVAEISLNGNVYGALVDTGADKSFILEDVVNKERLGVDNTNQRIRTVGSTVTSSGLVRAVVEVNGPKKELGLIVLKDLPYEIILGMDAFRELDILIDGKRNMD